MATSKQKIQKITGIWEKKLLRRLLQTDQQISKLYSDYADTTGKILAQYRAKKNGVVIRDPDLDKQLEGATADLKIKLQKQIEDGQYWAYASANDKTDEILSGYLSKIPQSIIASKGFFERNEEAFRSFLKRKYEGLGLSDRVWNLAKDNQKQLETYLENGLFTGKSAQLISQDIKQLLNEPDKVFRRVKNKETGKLELSKAAKAYSPGKGTGQGVYRSATQNAKRLARTEINMAYRSADQIRWNSLDFVLGYEVCLSGSHPTPDICDEAAGHYPKTFVFVGWHPNCLCYIVPILASEDQLMDNIVDGKEFSGYIKDVPEGFKNWVSTNQEKISGWKSQPFFVRDNFKSGRIEKGLKEQLI